MCLFEPQSRGSDEPFVFRGFPCEVISHEGDFVDLALPYFLFDFILI